jgi:hypothetical protein
VYGPNEAPATIASVAFTKELEFLIVLRLFALQPSSELLQYYEPIDCSTNFLIFKCNYSSGKVENSLLQ